MEEIGRLLIVDDDRAIRKLLERIARRAGFAVDTARDGMEALEMLDRVDYDVALVDLMMPRLSGYELVQQISKRERRPIVLVATALTNADVASLDDSLVRHVIRKPFDVHAVAAALVEAVQTLAARRAGAKAASKATIPIAEPSSPPAEPPAPAADSSPAKANGEKSGEPEGPVKTEPPC